MGHVPRFMWVQAMLCGSLIATASAQICTPGTPEFCPAMYLRVSQINGVPVAGGPCTDCNVQPGDLLTLEVWGRCWSMTGSICRAFQTTLLFDSCLTGDAGDTAPNMFFTTTDPMRECPNPPSNPQMNPTAATVDTMRADWIFNGLEGPVWSANTLGCDYQIASAVSGVGRLGLCTAGIDDRAYMSTFMLRVSNDATGDFEVALATYLVGGFPASRFSAGPGLFTPGVMFEPVILRVGDVIPGDCNGNIVSSAPANGSIDAGQPHAIGSVDPAQGWQSVMLTLDSPSAKCTMADFSVSVTPNDVAAPAIQSVVPDGNNITINFVAPIPPGHWTQITHNDDSPTSTCLGSLPADVSGDRTSGPLDILRLIDALNGVGMPLPLFALDVNRSGQANPQDILTEIDLLNGAGEYEVWNNRSIPVSPCGP